MKAFDKIFKINEDGLLEINKPEIRGIKAFREIVERDKGQHTKKGDYDGRKKLFAFKELMYVHLYSSVAGIYKDLPEDAKHANCKRDAELHDTWKPDSVIKRACEKYNKIETLSAVYHAYINTSKGLFSIGEDVKFFNTQKERARAKIQENIKILEVTELEEEKQRLEAQINTATNKLLDWNNKILAITNSLPTAYATLEEIHKKVIEESQKSKVLYGGGTVNNREQ